MAREASVLVDQKSLRNRRKSAGPDRRHEAPDVPGLALRKAAARLLGAVLEAATPLDGLTDDEHGHPQYLALTQRDRALARAILLSALRHHGGLEHALSLLTDRPLPPNATALRHILHVGLAQILFLDIPDHAAVALAVEAARADPRANRFAALVNAVLRRAVREREALLAAIALAPAGPQWFVARLRQAWGKEAADAILAAHAAPPALDLTLREDVTGWATRLGGEALGPSTVRLVKSDTPVNELPGYAEGAWWVQDWSASLPARLFGDLSGKTALDLCAAPGGKTAQLALAGAKVTALDRSANRLKRLRANLQRLKLEAEVLEGDAQGFDDGRVFDAVLLDAPCSSTGTVRRHPDVPFTKSPDEVAKLAALQARMLDHAAALTAPGGMLVFSNCSIDPAEGEEVVADFLARHDDFYTLPVAEAEIGGIAEAIDTRGQVRTLPFMTPPGAAASSGMDGFFAARLRRRV